MMKKRINVSGDIASRRKIAERRIPAAVQPVILPEQDERQEKVMMHFPMSSILKKIIPLHCKIITWIFL